ncbi:hypothetical protein KAJ02_04150 [Candidatus Bipolaricaulota bacterium]|nr:hypothetical protein [Candidatus Bipolaricaulota bacterium]
MNSRKEAVGIEILSRRFPEFEMADEEADHVSTALLHIPTGLPPSLDRRAAFHLFLTLRSNRRARLWSRIDYRGAHQSLDVQPVGARLEEAF